MHKLKNFFIIFIMAFAALSGNAVSYNCNESVDRIVALLNSLTLRIKDARNVKELESVSITPEMGQTLNNIYQNCKDYKLTSLNKTQLNKAYEELIVAYIEKFYEFSPQRGIFSKSELFNMIRPILIDPIKNHTHKCATLGEWIEYFSSFFKAISKSFPTTGTSGNISNKDGAKSVKLRVSNVQDKPDPLAPRGSNTYNAKNMFDGKNTTGWGVNLDKFYGYYDSRWGPEFDINAKRIDHIKILNGYAKSNIAYLNNTRANWILIYRIDERDEDHEFIDDEDIIYAGPLKDVNEFQTLKVDSKFDNTKPTQRVGLVFECGDSGFYLGKKYRDLFISELEFYGEPQ